MLDPGVLVLIITGVGGLATSVAVAIKTLAEARQIAYQATSARAAAEQAARQVTPTSGGALQANVADSVTRTDARVRELAKSVGGLRDDRRQDREALQSHIEDSRSIHDATSRRLDRIEEAFQFTSAATPSTIIQPPERRRP